MRALARVLSDTDWEDFLRDVEREEMVAAQDVTAKTTAMTSKNADFTRVEPFVIPLPES
jgi:hypothetical protein